MLAYRDFVPRMITPAARMQRAEFESLQTALDDGNDWVKSNDVDVVNVETVVLPNIHHPHEEGSEDVDLRHDDDFVHTQWHQFVRVWYRKS